MMMYQSLYIAPNLQFTVYISVPDELREPSGTDNNDIFDDGQEDDDNDDDGNDEDGDDADEYDNDYDDDDVEDDGDRQCMDTTDLYLVSRKS